MRTVLLKSSSGNLELQDPDTRVGVAGGVATYAVTDVPDDVSADEVLLLAKASGINGGWTVEFDRLGSGRFARAA